MQVPWQTVNPCVQVIPHGTHCDTSNKVAEQTVQLTKSCKEKMKRMKLICYRKDEHSACHS